jgi:hypothetical protein
METALKGITDVHSAGVSVIAENVVGWEETITCGIQTAIGGALNFVIAEDQDGSVDAALFLVATVGGTGLSIVACAGVWRVMTVTDGIAHVDCATDSVGTVGVVGGKHATGRAIADVDRAFHAVIAQFV